MAIAALAVTVAAASGARAQDATAQTDFFREGSTARSFGMGNAFVAVADDIGAAYWNPAGLALLSGATFSTTRSTLDIFDLNTQTLSFAAPVYGGVAALNFVYSSISGGIETEFDPITGRLVPVGTFEETDSALSLSFGKEYRENLYLGGTLKHARQKVSRFSASGFGLDLAALYQYNSGSSTMSTLFMNTTMCGTPTCLASSMCSLVCGIGPSSDPTTSTAPSICAAPVIMFLI